MVCSLICSVNLFPKYLILAVQLKTKKSTMRSDNPAVSGSIADGSNFMSDCNQMQVRLENGKYINLERKKYQANMLQNGLNYVGESSRKSSVKQCS